MNRKDFRPNENYSSATKSTGRIVGDRDYVIKRFINGEKAKTSNESLHTDGRILYSYNTAIGVRQADGRFVLNNTKYSSTTSQQQGKLRQALKDSGKSYDVTGGKDRGYEGEDYENTDFLQKLVDDVKNPEYKKESDKRTIKVYAEHSHNPVSDEFVNEMQKEHGIKTTKKEVSQILGYSSQIADEKKASKEYSKLADKNPQDSKKLKEISKEESTHAKELKGLERNKSFETQKEKEKIMNKQLPTKNNRIEMGRYHTQPNGFVDRIFTKNFEIKKVVYVNNVKYKYEKSKDNKHFDNYVNSNGEALHYTDINKSEIRQQKVNYTDVTDDRVNSKGFYLIKESGFTGHIINGKNSRDALKKYNKKYGVNADVVNITYHNPS